MDNFILSQPTRSGNNYWLSKHLNVCGCAHPQLIDLDSKDEYYHRKLQYLSKYLTTGDYANPCTARLNGEMILNNVLNLKQLVFEVTDACNLRCKYCGFGDLYEGYDVRRGSFLSLEQVQPLLDYLVNLWNRTPSDSYNGGTTISFYGGEPLLNMHLIEQVVNFFLKLQIKGKHFTFSMTSNATLLDKHMDFLAENEFALLISLDGNRENHSYRVNHAGENSFEKVVENVNLLRQRHPEYFEKHVNFNAVLHNRNSVESISTFIHEKYSKMPMISELNNSDILPDKRAEFGRLYKNWAESLYQSEHYEELERRMFISAHSYKDATTFLHQYSGYVFKTYNDLLYKREKKMFVPTGTCIPFGKRMFVTVNGKILPCERVDHQYVLGQIIDKEVFIDYEAIATRYNRYYDSLVKQCSSCYRSASCMQCVLNLPNLETKPVCRGYVGEKDFSQYVAQNMGFLEQHREDYVRIMKDVVVQ